MHRGRALLHGVRANAALPALMALSACSNSAGTGAAPNFLPNGPAQRTGSALVEIPAAAAGAARVRRPEYISPSVASVAIVVSGIDAAVIANIASSKICVTNARGRTCAVPIAAPVGTDTVSATLYDGPDATGKKLGTGSSRTTVSASGFSVALSVNGVVAGLRLAVAGPAAFSTGVASSTTITVVATDADGNAIAGTFAAPILLVLSDPSAFKLTPATISASGQTATLAYDGAAGVTAVTVNASASGVAAAAVVPITLAVTPGSPAPLTLSQTFLQFDATGVTSAPITITGPATTNFAAMTASTSDPSVATVALGSTGRQFSVTAVGVGSATITVVPSDNSAGAATLSVQVQTTTVAPQERQ